MDFAEAGVESGMTYTSGLIEVTTVWRSGREYAS